MDSWRLPTSKTRQNDLALAYATDGYTLLKAVYAPASPVWLRELPAVQTLRCVLVQNYTRTADRAGRLRASGPRTAATAYRRPHPAWPPPTTPTPAGPPSASCSGTATSSTSRRPATRRPTSTAPPGRT
ncbi:hypothetical protein ACWFR5_22345 [Streptomyces sp. NPDC055092]